MIFYFVHAFDGVLLVDDFRLIVSIDATISNFEYGVQHGKLAQNFSNQVPFSFFVGLETLVLQVASHISRAALADLVVVQPVCTCAVLLKNESSPPSRTKKRFCQTCPAAHVSMNPSCAIQGFARAMHSKP